MTQPEASPPPLTRRTSRYAIGAFVLGLLSFVAGYFGVLTGLLSTVLGFLALRHQDANALLKGRKLAIAGMVLGGLAALFALTIYDWNALFHDTPTEHKIHMGGPAHWP